MIQNNMELRIGQNRVSLGGLSEKGVDKKKNQDSYKVGVDEKNELAYIIVADGLGSCKCSDQGSARITEIIENWIVNKLPEYSYLSDNMTITGKANKNS